jgi:hypothetical protein
MLAILDAGDVQRAPHASIIGRRWPPLPVLAAAAWGAQKIVNLVKQGYGPGRVLNWQLQRQGSQFRSNGGGYVGAVSET